MDIVSEKIQNVQTSYQFLLQMSLIAVDFCKFKRTFSWYANL